MTDPSTISGVRRRAMATALLGVACLACGLGGCAGVGDSFASVAFVDPAKYDQFDCKQLEAERKSLATRTTDLQRLIDKAGNGVGGSMVGEMVYRNDYISVRASAKLMEQNWRANKCVETLPTAAASPAPAAATSTDAKRGRKLSAGAQ